MQRAMIERAKELLLDQTVNRVAGWKKGDLSYDITPAIFENADEIDADFIYNDFCEANLSKYMIKESGKEGKILVFLKPCDTYSFQQLLKEHRILRENVYIIGIPCNGKINAEVIKSTGVEGILSMECNEDTVTVHTLYGDSEMKREDALAERCVSCKSHAHVIYDELLGETGEVLSSDRFRGVEELESMSPEERFAFWRNELSKCIRCNACRNVCPACSCEQCIFDNPASGVSQKAAADSFEENMFHIIRAFHVAGRCTDCGECSRVCPQHIPLHLLNRKFIKDINTFYGEYQAGADADTLPPLHTYLQGDTEPGKAF